MRTSRIPSRQRAYGLYRLSRPGFDVAAEIMRGLRLPQKTIDPKFFYDARGAQLYEKITQTFDYYVTRTENDILRCNAASIAESAGRGAAVVEPGAGNCRKIEYLLEALRPNVYVPIDVSGEALELACDRLAASYRWLECVGVIAEFDQIDYVAELLSNRNRLVFFPGSTLGNMHPRAAVDFLSRMRKFIGREGGILIGVDNIKDEDVLNRAYNDSLGFTAEFNKNILLHLNRIADANFLPEKFEHRAFFNRNLSRVEMHLVSLADQVAQVAGQRVEFRCGETIHTENSYKYSRASFRALAAEAGLQCMHGWHDQRDYFTVYYLAGDPHHL